MSDINLNAQGDITAGEFVGRDKTTNQITNIYTAQNYRNEHLLEVTDEAITINVPVGGLTVSVLGPIKPTSQSFSEAPVSTEEEPEPLLYDHKGNAIKTKPNRPKPAIRYFTKITNKGEKTVDIYEVFFDYGSRSDESKRVRLLGLERTYLAPREVRGLSFELSQSDLESTMEKFQIDECILFLRVICRADDGEFIFNIRNLGGYRKGHDDIAGIGVLSISYGDALTGPLREDISKGLEWVEIPMAK